MEEDKEEKFWNGGQGVIIFFEINIFEFLYRNLRKTFINMKKIKNGWRKIRRFESLNLNYFSFLEFHFLKIELFKKILKSSFWHLIQNFPK